MLTSAKGEERFDAVIMATHSDTTLRILRGAGAMEGGGVREEEEKVLSAFQWSRNEGVLHCDTEVRILFFFVSFIPSLLDRRRDCGLLIVNRICIVDAEGSIGMVLLELSDVE